MVHEHLQVEAAIRVDRVRELLEEPERVLWVHRLVTETLGKLVSDALKGGV